MSSVSTSAKNNFTQTHNIDQSQTGEGHERSCGGGTMNKDNSNNNSSTNKKTESREWKITKKKARLLKALTDTGWEPEKMLHKLKIYSWDKEKAMARYNRDDFCHFFCIEGHCRSGDSCKYGDHSLWIGQLMTESKKLTLAMHLCEYLFYFNRFGNNAFNWRNNASLHGYYAMILSKNENVYRNLKKSEKHFITALELNPNHSRNLYAYVDFLRNCLNDTTKADFIQENGYQRQNPLIETTMYNQNELHDEMSTQMQSQLPPDIIARQVPKSNTHHNFNANYKQIYDLHMNNNGNNNGNSNSNVDHSHHYNSSSSSRPQTEFIIQKPSSKQHGGYINSKVHSTMASAVGSAAPTHHSNSNANNNSSNTNSGNNNSNNNNNTSSSGNTQNQTNTNGNSRSSNNNSNNSNSNSNNNNHNHNDHYNRSNGNSNTNNNQFGHGSSASPSGKSRKNGKHGAASGSGNNNESRDRANGKGGNSNNNSNVQSRKHSTLSSNNNNNNNNNNNSNSNNNNNPSGGGSHSNLVHGRMSDVHLPNSSNGNGNSGSSGGNGGNGGGHGNGNGSGGGVSTSQSFGRSPRSNTTNSIYDAEYASALQKNNKKLNSFYEEWFNNDARSMAEIVCCFRVIF